MVSAAKRKHLQNKILESTSSKTLYSTMNVLLGTSTNSPLPTTYSKNELPSVFSTYFSDKIQALRDTLDTLPSKPPPPPTHPSLALLSHLSALSLKMKFSKP
jgi:hypothetical protein